MRANSSLRMLTPIPAVIIPLASSWEAALSRGKCYFLSRPRRFGKSMLLSTLKTYFQGKKEEFEGLAIAKLEKEWKQYPVLHADLNTALYTTPEALTGLLDFHFRFWEEEYGIEKKDGDVSSRFRNIIVSAAQRSPEGKVVILIDEYDKPLLEAIGKPELQEEYRQILKAFYSNINILYGTGTHITRNQ